MCVCVHVCMGARARGCVVYLHCTVRNTQGGGRVEQCYLDYAPLVVRVGAGWSKQGWFPNGGTLTMIEGNLFLGSTTIILQAVNPQSTVHVRTVLARTGITILGFCFYFFCFRLIDINFIRWFFHSACFGGTHFWKGVDCDQQRLYYKQYSE